VRNAETVLKGATVSIDAIATNPAIAQKILDQGSRLASAVDLGGLKILSHSCFNPPGQEAEGIPPSVS
jgi:hypothetical protein